MSNYRRRTSPRRFRSLSYKKKVLKSVHSIGLSKTLRKLNVTKDQVKSWLGKEEEILNSPGEWLRRPCGRDLYAGLEQEEQVLFQWIMEARRAREMVYTDEVIGKAGRLFAQVGEEERAKANRRWLGSFKKRFKLYGEIVDRPKAAQVLSDPKPLPASAYISYPLTREISALIDFSPGEMDIYPGVEKSNEPIVLDLEAFPVSTPSEVIDLASTP